jgi:cobalt-zinc-cadmium efflux system outer membrane protein
MNYRKQVLKESERGLEGARISYRNGTSSLLELLSAQRTADQIAFDRLQEQAHMANATVSCRLVPA